MAHARVPHLSKEAGKPYYYQRRIPKALHGTIGRTKWHIPLGSGEAQAVAKCVALTAEHDALIDSLKSDEAKARYRTTARRERESAEAIRDAKAEDAERRRALRDPEAAKELAAQAALAAELDPTSWQLVPHVLSHWDREFARNDPLEALAQQEKADAQHRETERALLAHDPASSAILTREPLPPAIDADEYLDRLKDTYASFYGPDAPAAPSDPDQRDEYDLWRMRLERKIARLTPAGDRISVISERYFAFAGLRDSTLRKYRQHIGDLITTVGDIPVKHVTPVQLREHRDALMGKLQISSVRAHYTAIGGMFSYALEEGLIDVTPMAGVKLPRDKRSVEESKWLPFAPDEASRILTRAAEVWGSPLAGVPEARRLAYLHITRLLFFSTLRPGEALSLTPADVTDEAITIRSGKTDNARRVHPLHPEAKGFHAWIHAGGMSAFDGVKGLEGRTSLMRQNFARLIRDKLDPPITEPRKALYSTRSTFQNALRRAGVDKDVRRALMGHAESGALRHYDDGPEFEIKRHAVSRSDPRA